MNDKTINQVVEAAIQKPTKQAVAEAVSKLLAEDITVGQEVTSVSSDDIIGGYVGNKGRVTKLNAEGGWAEVEFPGGVKVQAITSLLIPV